MNDFDDMWLSHTKTYNEQNEQIIMEAISNAERIVFVAKGRVGLSSKMFMQRLIQSGHKAYHSEDLNVPKIGPTDLVIFVTASGNTASSYAYVDIAKNAGVKTMAITYNPQGRISKEVDICVDYEGNAESALMKSYYEIGFIYIFEKLIHRLPANNFTHTNFE